MSRAHPGFSRLFSPVKIGNFQAKNRIAAAPTGRGDCNPDGTPNDQTICSYVALAKGGVGLVIVELTMAINNYGQGMSRLLGIHSDSQMLSWRQLSDTLHALKALAVVQLSPGIGRWARRRDSIEVVAPSEVGGEIPLGSAPKGLKRFEGARSSRPRALTTEEVEEMGELYVAAARRVKRAGFDGIEFHGAHGYLLAQFLSPATNRRQDKYGGSFERRLTFPLNLILKTREAVGNDFILGFRISGDEHMEGGYSLEDTRKMVPALIGAGLDYIHVSSGCISAWNWTFPPKEGVIAPEAAEVKKVSSVPVICPNIHLPRLGESVIAEGKADIVSLSRGLLCDPQWPNKVREGREKEIVKCLFCNTCLDHIHNDFGVRCPQNPRVGWERFFPEYQPPLVTVPRVQDPR
ncbi:MAG: NADH:flavin oxidoreductase [Dehalococcoidia bacterium]|nr:NADH:flavin oxidoreductase [Dehalococcoidia bacterium]MDP7239768.1 NADH:flavin oxidoreductase [Dehalococcoidia bacterium]MDP7469750.1 NADH:flavin oxidoreductase [Dehalococcoidia bacterium]